MQPFDYRIAVRDPVQMALAGYQQGQQLQNERERMGMQREMFDMQRQQFQAQQMAAEAQQARAIELQTVMGSLAERIQSGTVSPEEIVTIGLQFPEVSEQINSVYDAMTTMQREGSIRELSRFAVALSRSPEVALGLLDERLAAAEEAGLVDEVNQLKAMKGMAQMDPSAPLAAVLMELGVLMEPKQFENFMAVAMPKSPEAASAEGKVMQDYRAGFFGEPGTPEAQDAARRAIENLKKQPLVTNIVGGELSPGAKAIDEGFAPIALEWMTGGGSDTAKQLAQLDDVLAQLEAGEPITGARVGYTPEFVRALTDPKAVDAQEAVEEVVQRNLRLILGAQFTEREGERLIRRAYNPKLDPKVNARRVRRLVQQISIAADQRQAMVDYFNENQTLRGYAGKVPTIADFDAALNAADAPASGAKRKYNPETGELE